MSQPDRRPVLVMGARGSVGRIVLESLIEIGVPVRASTRNPDRGGLPDGVEVFAADLTDRGSLVAAFDGVGQVFTYADHRGVADVVDAARSAGVETVVLLSSGSVLHARSAGNAITEEHRAVEDAYAAATDLRVVPVRPLVLATHALSWSWATRAGQPLGLYQPDAVTAPVHEKDVAAVAVAALTGGDPTSVGQLLTGPARISQREQVAAIGAATGKDIEVAELTRADALARLSPLTGAEQAEAVLQFLDDAADDGSPATDAVRRLLGRPATDFAAWAADHAAEF